VQMPSQRRSESQEKSRNCRKYAARPPKTAGFHCAQIPVAAPSRQVHRCIKHGGAGAGLGIANITPTARSAAAARAIIRPQRS
jgi:hypothetical protein